MIHVQSSLRFTVFQLRLFNGLVITWNTLDNMQVFYALMSSFVDYLVYVGYQRAMKRANTISLSVEIGLRFIGMWPDSAYPNLYWFSYMTTIAIMQYYQYTYIFVHFDLNDLWLLMDCLSLTLAYSLAFLKLLVLWWNRR